MSATTGCETVFKAEIPVVTGRELDVVDITGRVESLVGGSGIENGSVHLFVAGSTAALTTIEFEPGAVEDLVDALSRLAPADIPYAHNARWGDGNGHSHVRAAFLGPDITVPIRGGRPLLGTWQQVILVEFDTRGRKRNVHLTAAGKGFSDEGKG